MSRISECLEESVRNGLITNKESEKYTRMHKYLTDTMRDENAAGELVGRMISHDADNMVKQAAAFDRVAPTIGKTLDRVKTGRDLTDSIRNLTTTKQIDVLDGHVSTYSVPTHEALRKFSDADMLNMADIDQDTIIKHLLGEKSGNKKLAGLAEGMEATISAARQNIRRLGGAYLNDPPKNSVPVSVQRGALQSIDEATFVADMKNSIDINHLTSNVPAVSASKEGVDGYLRTVYKALKSGANGLSEDELAGSSPSNFNRNFLNNIHTSDFDAWKNVQQKYGVGKSGEYNIVSAHSDYIQKLSETASELEAFGGSLSRYGKVVEKELRERGQESAIDKLRDNITFMRGGYDKVWTPENTTGLSRLTVQLTKGLNIVKALSPIKLLGGAPIMAALTDPLYRASAAKFYGMTAKGMHKTLTAGLETGMKRVVHENNRFVARLGLSTKHTADLLSHGVRGYTSTLGVESVEKVSSWTLRKSGLPYVTDAGRAMNLKNMAMNMAEMRKMPYEELAENLKADMDLFGFTKEDWDITRKLDVVTEEGVEFMSPSSVMKTHPEQARKLASLYSRAQEMGTPTTSVEIAKARAKYKAISPETGVIMDMLATFQNFNGSMYERWLSRGGLGKGVMLGKMAVKGYMIGMVGVHLNNLRHNRTTNFFSIETHIDAFTRGGVSSYFGDIVAGAAGAIGIGFNQSFAEFVGRKASGVALGTVFDIADTLGTFAVKAAEGKETKLGSDLLRIAEGFNPGKNHWATGAFYDETIGNSLREFFSEKNARRYRNLQKARMKKDGTEKIIK